ncbi:MAG: type II toxin-antitoxin system TacA family antitoxin [Sporichthyaceae bacterium]
MTATKPDRIAARLTAEQGEIIRRAAEVEGSTITEFAVSAAVARAREVLADQRLFVLDDVAWTEFAAALDAPVRPRPRLARLLATPAVFEE